MVRLFVCLLAVACALSATQLMARTAIEPLTVAEAMSVRSFVPLPGIASFSPDGTLIAYSVCDPQRVQPSADGKARLDALRFAAGCALQVIPRTGGAPFTVDHDGSSWAPAWSPDGEWLA